MTAAFAEPFGVNWLHSHYAAIARKDKELPEDMTNEQLADALQSLAIATADPKSAAILDAASVRVLEMQEKNELQCEALRMLESELRAIEERSQ